VSEQPAGVLETRNFAFRFWLDVSELKRSDAKGKIDVTVAIARLHHRLVHEWLTTLCGDRRATARSRGTMRSQSELALTTLQADAVRIIQAATEFAAIQSTLAPFMLALTKEPNEKPLPARCVADADRVHNLNAAIEAANKSVSR
jgi:hypothetical protein